ncbi:hypothetical protein ISS37_06345 [candidate division KSB1 bacterium]|nr:hypothetical protein [candidate division KSB1 bacterium]
MEKLGGFSFSSELEREVLRSQNRIVMVLGGPGTGKTTLVEGLADLLSEEGSVGVVDLDMGQSHLGPPTTIAWGLVEGGFIGWENIVVRDMYFTGSTSPVGHLLPTITGARINLDRVTRAVEKVIIDTTGLIDGEIGRVLKWHLIDLLRPRIIIALERTQELEPILRAYRPLGLRGTKGPIIYRMPVPSGAKLKTQGERSLYREKKFREYFGKGRLLRVEWRRIGVRGTEGLVRHHRDLLLNRLVSLRDLWGNDRALGLVMGIDFDKGLLSVLTPLPEEAAVGAIALSDLRITREGKQL